jgi:hypothetical protein
VQPLRHQLRHAATDELPAPRGKSVMGVGWRRGRGRGTGKGKERGPDAGKRPAALAMRGELRPLLP